MATRTTGSRDRSRDDSGLSMVTTAVSLLVVALLVLFGAKATLGSSNASSTGSSVHQPLSQANATAAQQTLSIALTAVGTAVGAAGSYAGIDASTLQTSEPSITFVDGPSAGSDTVSVASTTDDSGSVALADLSSDGTCWFVWRSQIGTWFGARTGGGSCSAQQVQQTPSPAPVSDTSIGWQQGSFPST